MNNRWVKKRRRLLILLQLQVSLFLCLGCCIVFVQADDQKQQDHQVDQNNNNNIDTALKEDDGELKEALLEELHELGMPKGILPVDSPVGEIRDLVDQFRKAFENRRQSPTEDGDVHNEGKDEEDDMVNDDEIDDNVDEDESDDNADEDEDDDIVEELEAAAQENGGRAVDNIPKEALDKVERLNSNRQQQMLLNKLRETNDGRRRDLDKEILLHKQQQQKLRPDDIQKLLHKQQQQKRPLVGPRRREGRRGGGAGGGGGGSGKLFRQEWNKDDDFLFTLPKNMKQLPLGPKVEWLGVLLDGGRHYFDVDWILNLLDMLHMLRFNMLHFRLTDDQAFNVKLESHPELATPAYESNHQVYSVAELKRIQAHAKERNITIMPEINVPGHAASWAGPGPGMLPACAKFICKEGYGVPLNVTYPPLMGIIKDVIKEVMDIFENPPHLHLGGDEVHLAEPCFHELKQSNQDYQAFEEKLTKVVQELGISEDGIIRWEMTSQLDHNGRPVARTNTPKSNAEFIKYQVEGRTGKMTHWWHAHHNHLYDTMDGEGTSQVFVSQGLYMDINNMMPGSEVYQHVSNLARHKWKPKGVVVGCFELGMQFWWDRGVVGRLLAASMGASDAGHSTEPDASIKPEDYDFEDRYKTYCEDNLQLSNDYCGLLGIPPVDANKWRSGPWRQLRYSKWKDMVCNRLTEPGEEFQLVGRAPAKDTIQTDAMVNFWNHFGGDMDADDGTPVHNSKLEKALEGRFGQHVVSKTGIILDITHDYMGEKDSSRIERLREVIDVMAKLGFNLLQLRVMDDYYFQLEMPSHRNLATTQKQRRKPREKAQDGNNEETAALYREHHDVTPMNYSNLKTVVDYARQHGIEVMPEISVTSRAGGWIHSGFSTPCPNYMCTYGVDLKVELQDPAFLGVLSSVVYELRDVFSSDYFHLGYAHDTVNVGCYNEVDRIPDIDEFEHKLEHLMELQGVPPEKIVRWEYPTKDDDDRSSEAKVAGTTIHTLHQQEPSKGTFVTTGLNFEDPENELEDAWAIYDHVKGLTSVEPTAVLAWVGSFGTSIWDRLLIKERLLAVALALSQSQEDYGTREDFEPVYEEACSQFQWKHCDALGKIPENKVKLLAQELNDDYETQLDEVCSSRTKKFSTRFPRRGVLVPSDDGADHTEEPVTTADAKVRTEEQKEESQETGEDKETEEAAPANSDVPLKEAKSKDKNERIESEG